MKMLKGGECSVGKKDEIFSNDPEPEKEALGQGYII